MKRLFVFQGKGRCAAATAYVLGIDEHHARLRLLRDDASPYFEIGSVAPFAVLVPPQDRDPR